MTNFTHHICDDAAFVRGLASWICVENGGLADAPHRVMHGIYLASQLDT